MDDIEDEGKQLVGILKRFVDGFIADTRVAKNIYDLTVVALVRLSEFLHFMPELIRLYPVLEKSRHFNEEHENNIKTLRAVIIAYELAFKDDIHANIAYLTMNLLFPEQDEEVKQSQLETETEIVFSLDEVRPSIRKLRKKYPELYELNADFYKDCLEKNQEEHLMSKYAKQNINPADWSIPLDNPSSKMSYIDMYEDDEEPIIQPIRREQPKIGRNDPCPCGSGRKYKKCCGR